MGSVEMAWAYYPQVNNRITVISMPFLFESYEQARSLLDSPFYERLEKESEENGFHVLAWHLESGRHISNNKRPIEKPDDVKRLLIRVPPIEVIAKSMDALGASIQSISLGDLYMACKTGVVDGLEMNLINFVDQHYEEVQEYLSLVDYFIYPGVLCLNLAFYEALPVKYQKLIDLAAQTAVDYFHWSIDANLVEYEQYLREKMVVNDITTENHELFVEKLKPLWQEFIDQGYFSQEDIDEIQQYLENKE
jgi:TRAP-type C4-dicarboxylate transport system substrate-binding protein